MREQLKSTAPFALRVLWISFIAAPVFWVTICALKQVGISGSDTASWVQAFGSIIAIWGAFQLGTLQYKRSQSEKLEAISHQKQHTKNVMHRLSQDIYFHMHWLGIALMSNEEQAGHLHWSEYKVRGLDLRWQHQLDALKSVNVQDLDGVQTLLLADLKTACSFAIYLCSLPENIVLDEHKATLLLKQFSHHESAAKMAYTVLSPPGWEIS